jgi:hypothetical protein
MKQNGKYKTVIRTILKEKQSKKIKKGNQKKT